MFAGYGLARHAIRGTIMLKYLLVAMAVLCAPAAYGDEFWPGIDFECDPETNYFYFGYTGFLNMSPDEAEGTDIPSNRAFKAEEWTGHREILTPGQGLTIELIDGPIHLRHWASREENAELATCVVNNQPVAQSGQASTPLVFEARRIGRRIFTGRGDCGAWYYGGLEILLNGQSVQKWPSEREVCMSRQSWSRLHSIEFAQDDGFSICQRTLKESPPIDGSNSVPVQEYELTCDTTTPDFPAAPPAD
jgi:hypothetical protein